MNNGPSSFLSQRFKGYYCESETLRQHGGSFKITSTLPLKLFFFLKIDETSFIPNSVQSAIN